MLDMLLRSRRNDAMSMCLGVKLSIIVNALRAVCAIITQSRGRPRRTVQLEFRTSASSEDPPDRKQIWEYIIQGIQALNHISNNYTMVSTMLGVVSNAHSGSQSIKVGDTIPEGTFPTVYYTPELEDGSVCGTRKYPWNPFSHLSHASVIQHPSSALTSGRARKLFCSRFQARSL